MNVAELMIVFFVRPATLEGTVQGQNKAIGEVLEVQLTQCPGQEQAKDVRYRDDIHCILRPWEASALRFMERV